MDIPQEQYTQQSIPISSDEMYATSMQEDRVRNIISQISPDNQLMELQWRLKGYILDPFTREWVKIEKTVAEPSPLMVSKYVSFTSSILNQNTTLSTMQPEEINRIMKFTIEWFVDDMDTNAEIYGVNKDYSERTRIGMMLLNFIFMVLKRSQMGIESKRMWGSLSLSEAQNPNAQTNKKQSLLQSLRDWKV